MRRFALVVVLVSLFWQPGNTQVSLAGLRYAIVVPPRYQDGRIDALGLGQYLADRLREDTSWQLITEIPDGADPNVVAQTAVFYLTHETGKAAVGVTIELRDVAGNPLRTFRATSLLHMKRAVGGALAQLREARPKFDPTQTRTLPEIFSAEVSPVGEADFRAYLSSAALQPVEGIWTDEDGDYRLAIKRDGENRFTAIVLATKSPFWSPGMVKARFEALATGGSYIGHYRMADHHEVSAPFTLEANTLIGVIKDRGDGQSDRLRLVRVESGGTTPDKGRDSRSTSTSVVSTGTGFVVAPGILATNYHVIANGNAWTVTFPTLKTTLPLSVLVSDRANDLALLKIDTSGATLPPPLRIVSSRAARLGEEVYTVGFPLTGVLSSGHKVATGVVSALAGIGDDPRVFQITVPTQAGNSGGPIFNGRGEVVGILASTLSVEFLYRSIQQVPQNVNFAIKSDYLSLLVGQVDGATVVLPTVNTSSTRADQIEQSQSSIGQITTLN